LQPACELPAANQMVANEAHHQSNLQPTPFPDFDFEKAVMGQQEPNMMGIELQHQKKNQQQHHVHHQQEYQQQQEWQQQQQQQQQPQQKFPNPIYQQPMQTFSQEQVQQQQQQQQQPMLPNQIEKLNPLQQQPMEVILLAKAQNHYQQKLQQQQNIAHHQLRFQEDSQPILLDNHSQFQQQANSVNQHELILQLQEGSFSGLLIFVFGQIWLYLHSIQFLSHLPYQPDHGSLLQRLT
jgi:hypothetical protein